MTTATVSAPVDFREVFAREEASLDDFLAVRRSVHSSIDTRSDFERFVEDFKKVEDKLASENKAQVRKGIALWILGKIDDARQIWEKARASREGHFFIGLSHLERQEFGPAAERLVTVLESDASAPVVLAAVEALALGGKVEEAQKQLHRHRAAVADTADGAFLEGLCSEMEGNWTGAQSAYEKALAMDPQHALSLFRLAYGADLRGDDDEAFGHYLKLKTLRPPHVHALINLGVIHEDRGEYEKALECFELVLETDPNHSRAQLYRKDAAASLTMYYDEELKRRENRWAQLLSTPITELQFSVRVRNAMSKLDAHTLGDLITRTEEELMGCANFGETSLKELKEVLGQRGLSLAQPAGGLGAKGKSLKDAVLAKSVNDFEWSARVKKCFEQLEVKTVGDLTSRTERDLLKCKNFGDTSLQEVRERLSQLRLTLKPLV